MRGFHIWSTTLKQERACLIQRTAKSQCGCDRERRRERRRGWGDGCEGPVSVTKTSGFALRVPGSPQRGQGRGEPCQMYAPGNPLWLREGRQRLESWKCESRSIWGALRWAMCNLEQQFSHLKLCTSFSTSVIQPLLSLCMPPTAHSMSTCDKSLPPYLVFFFKQTRSFY